MSDEQCDIGKEPPEDIVFIDGNNADIEATCNEMDCFEKVFSNNI